MKFSRRAATLNAVGLSESVGSSARTSSPSLTSSIGLVLPSAISTSVPGGKPRINTAPFAAGDDWGGGDDGGGRGRFVGVPSHLVVLEIGHASASSGLGGVGGGERIETVLDFPAIGEGIAIAVPLEEISAVDVHFVAIAQAFEAGIRGVRIRAVHEFYKIGKSVIIRVVGCTVGQIAKVPFFPVIGQPIKVGIEGNQGIGAEQQFIIIAHLFAVEIRVERVAGRDVRIAQTEKELAGGRSETLGDYIVGAGFNERQILPGR